MVEVTRTVAAPPSAVWEVLADGWSYAAWVVGAVRVRAVDPGYPAVGTTFHHSVGVWPVVIDDRTEVPRCEPDRRLTLRGRAWPAGEALIDFELRADGDGTLVLLNEDAVSGPGKLVPGPARHLSLVIRNTETLRRLAFLAERRTAPG